MKVIMSPLKGRCCKDSSTRDIMGIPNSMNIKVTTISIRGLGIFHCIECTLIKMGIIGNLRSGTLRNK